MARILVVDDEANICWALKAELTAEGYTVDVAANGPEALDHIRKARPDLVLCDIRLPGMSGIDLLDRLREAAPAVPVILMTAYGDLDAAVGAMHKGAYEYLHKPLDLDQVKKTIVQALAGREAQILSSDAAMNGASEERGQAIRIVGRSVAMQQVFKLIGVVSQNDVTVLIEGEAGVGKELIARAIHQYSQRKAAPFVAVNCGGFSEGELERELFGGTGSAPAGREEWKGGGFESAHGGTLFLDEISELSISQQSKLLRILQEGHIERSRGAPTPVDTRVIAASNEPLREAVTAKRFREDLYFHLQVVKIAVPPLRHRKEDLYDLAAYFISLAARKTHRDLRGIQREAMEALVRHDWPGNVRELENVIRRAAVLARGAVIGLADLPPEIVEARRDGEPPEISGLRAAAEAELRARLQNADRGETSIYHDLVGTVEEGLVRAALAITGGNQVKAAELLGVNRTTLRKRLQPGSDDEPEQE